MDRYNYSSDSPASKKEDDRFSRWSFSERIAQVISKRSDPNCITIGIYGAWGSGKTSILNFIEESLSHDKNVICIKFNPWRFTTDDELLMGFFSDIARALDVNLIKRGEKLKDILKKVAPIADVVAKGAGESIRSFLSGPGIDKLKLRIESELESAKKRVLIIIDDVDRLEKIEIQAIFKLIKLTADFRYTAYILAFDKDIVSASLQDRYSSSASNAGEAFLEKIIQIPLHLPSVDKKILQRFCFQGVEEALLISEINLTEQQVQEFVSGFNYAFYDSVSTPRKAKQYGNILMFSLPILKNEVNPVDLMLIEGIRVFCPLLYEAIGKNKSLFAGNFSESTYQENEKKEKKEKVKSIIQSSLDLSKIDNTLGYIKLLKYLFPRLNSVYESMTFMSDSYQTWNSKQRICSENYFERYFMYSIPQDDISDNLISQMIFNFNKSKEEIEKSKNPLIDIITPDNLRMLISKLRNNVDLLTKNGSISLAVSLSLECELYPNPEVLFKFSEPFVQAAMLVSDLMKNLESQDRLKLAIDCINKATMIEFKLEIFHWLKRKNEDQYEKHDFSEEEINEIGNCLGKNIASYVEQNDITIGNPKIALDAFYCLKKYTEKEYFDEYIKLLLNNESEAVLRILDACTPTAWSLGSGTSHKSDFDRDNYDRLSKVINPNLIIKAIEKLCGQPPQLEESFPKFYEDQDKLMTVRQFVWIHRYVMNEEKASLEKEHET